MDKSDRNTDNLGLHVSQTDWRALETMTDADIERAIAQDPDAALILDPEDLKRRGKLHPPRIKR